MSENFVVIPDGYERMKPDERAAVVPIYIPRICITGKGTTEDLIQGCVAAASADLYDIARWAGDIGFVSQIAEMAVSRLPTELVGRNSKELVPFFLKEAREAANEIKNGPRCDRRFRVRFKVVRIHDFGDCICDGIDYERRYYARLREDDLRRFLVAHGRDEELKLLDRRKMGVPYSDPTTNGGKKPKTVGKAFRRQVKKFLDEESDLLKLLRGRNLEKWRF